MSVSGIGYRYYQDNPATNMYNKRKAGSFPQYEHASEPDPERVKQNASAQDIYEAWKGRGSHACEIGEEEKQVAKEGGLQVWFGDKTLEEWASTDPKYTDEKTGFSWYVRDGKHPYMTGEDAAKFKEMCRETGEPWLKKFAEMTGMIQYLDENTAAYVGTNGTAIKSKDGRELFLDTSALSYDMIMNLFRNLPETDDYFDAGYWRENIRNAKGTDGQESGEEKEAKNDEAESDTEIIVKADGSKVMMTTIRVGGMETVMSMEIAGPTDLQPGNPTAITDDANLITSNTNAMIESVPEK